MNRIKRYLFEPISDRQFGNEVEGIKDTILMWLVIAFFLFVPTMCGGSGGGGSYPELHDGPVWME